MTDVSEPPVFRLMYRSHDLIAAAERTSELGRLFTAARATNKNRHITGALLLHDDCFVQTLEGDEATVRELFAHIERDPRHDRVEVIDAEQVPTRCFARWSMARVAEHDDESDINLISHRDGIADAASRGDTTEEQTRLLDAMRDAARSMPATA